MRNIAVFASGNGSNAEMLARHFSKHPSVRVSLLLTNKAGAYVLHRAKVLGIKTSVFTAEQLSRGDVLKVLQESDISFIVLAGFLLKIPRSIIAAYPDRIINIHPSLLPSHGGKGMYGRYVHEAVLQSGDRESGITIHLVNEAYDKGRVLFRKSIPVLPDDTADKLAERIHELEHRYFPVEVGKYITAFDR